MLRHVTREFVVRAIGDHELHFVIGRDRVEVFRGGRDAARRVIAEHESIRLSREEQLAFVQALLNPPEPNAAAALAAGVFGIGMETLVYRPLRARRVANAQPAAQG